MGSIIKPTKTKNNLENTIAINNNYDNINTYEHNKNATEQQNSAILFELFESNCKKIVSLNTYTYSRSSIEKKILFVIKWHQEKDIINTINTIGMIFIINCW